MSTYYLLTVQLTYITTQLSEKLCEKIRLLKMDKVIYLLTI